LVSQKQQKEKKEVINFQEFYLVTDKKVSFMLNLFVYFTDKNYFCRIIDNIGII